MTEEQNNAPENKDNVRPRGFTSKKNLIFLILVAVLTFAIGGAVLVAGVSNTPENCLSRYMRAAERYLAEMDYERAVIEYQRALEIEPMNVDAILGLADAYIGLGDTDKAIEVLRDGLERTGDQKLETELKKLMEMQKIVISDFSGLERGEIEQILEELGISYHITEDYSLDIAADRLISDNIPEDRRVSSDFTAELVFSKGVKNVSIPELLTLSKEAVAEVCNQEGILVDFIEENSKSVPKGYVISQSSPAGTLIPGTDRITVIISLGPKNVIVPSMIGFDREEAERLCGEVGLSVVFNEDYNNSVSEGLIISQSISGGSVVLETAEISAVISLGTEMTTVPDVVGKLKQDALTAISKSKLRAVVSEEHSDTVSAGKVIRQEIPAGESKETDTELKVVISLGETPRDPIEKLLNSCTVTPLVCNYEPLNEVLSEVMDSIITEDMTNYDRLKACYDWLINNCSYGTNERMDDYIMDLFFGDYYEEVSAYGLLKGRVGVCDDYAAAFAAMARACGYECYCVSGQTHRASGGFTGHTWNVIYIDNVPYVFDAQVEDNIASGGTIRYMRFCKTYSQVSDKYKDYSAPERFLKEYVENKSIK